MVIPVGYRLNSVRGTQFRIWATKILCQHLVQGYTVHESRPDEKAVLARVVVNLINRQNP